MRIKFANYALKDLLYSLECSGVEEITITKEDNGLVINIPFQNKNTKGYIVSYNSDGTPKINVAAN